MNNLHNINIERAVLSSIIYNPAIFEDIVTILKPDDFYLPANKNIFYAMTKCFHDELPIDEEFLKKILSADGLFDESAMLDIISTNPLQNISAYINEIKEKSIKRELVRLTGDINDLAVEKDLPAKEVLDMIQQKLYKITNETNSRDFRESFEVTHSTIDYIKEMKRRGNSILVGLDTGFAELNKISTGFGAGDFVVVAARPSMGKTAFCLNLAQSVLDNNQGVAIFSLEMPAEQLMLRMLSAKTSIALQKLKVGNMEDDEWTRLSDAAEVMSRSNLYIDDQGNVDINQLRSRLRKLKTKQPEIALCIVDYLQLMTSVTSKDRHLEVSDISRGLKLLARELSIPIVALSQLNRSLESRGDKRPMLSDIRESGAIEQDADMILFVYRDDVYKMREEREKEKEAKKKNESYQSTFQEKDIEEAEIIIGKNRNGPTGVAHLLFHKKYTKFIDKEPIMREISYQKEGEFVLSDMSMPEI